MRTFSPDRNFGWEKETWDYVQTVYANSGKKILHKDIRKINPLVKYLKKESLWNYTRLFLMKSGQNTGASSTLYGLGGLTSANATLYNSPIWTSSGIVFNGSTQYASASQFMASTNATIFIRHVLAGTNGFYFCDGTNFSTGTSLYLEYNTNYFGATNYRAGRNDGVTSGQSIFSSTTTGDNTVVYSNENGITGANGAIKCWKNKTSISRSYTDITNTTRRTPTGDMNLFRRSDATNYLGLQASMFMYISSLITDTQREALTDLINAL